MTRNDPVAFAKRLYSRLPAHYRVYDAEQGLPLYALLTVVGEQAANLREDLDTLWDNFFIETCEPWVVPYIGALAGTNILTRPVGEINRLDVWNTVLWRRSKGTPGMLQSLAQSISGWPATSTEFFQSLGWSQNMNHVRLDRLMTPDLRDPALNGLLNRPGDFMAHAADFRPSPSLAEPRAGLGSPGRYNVRNIGFYVSRLQTFPITGVTPAAAAPGAVPPAGNSCFTFSPLFRDTPLFTRTGAAIRRSDLLADSRSYFGNDAPIAIRQSGVLLAADAPPAASTPEAPPFQAFTFGGATAGLRLDPTSGIRIIEAKRMPAGAAHFTISADWNAATTLSLGTIDTAKPVFTPGAAAAGPGRLMVRVNPGNGSPSTFFPGAVIAIRARSGALLRSADAIYVYLPPARTPVSFDVSQDGSTFLNGVLARAAEGQVYPPRPLTQSTRPAVSFVSLHKTQALALADPTRFGGSITFSAATDNNLLSIAITPNAGITSIPPAELIVRNRAGQSLLVYLPEIPNATPAGAKVFVADDGSTWFVPTDPATLISVQNQRSFSGLVLARAAAGQTLPITGVWPLQQRRPVAANLCSPLRSSMLAPDELGIDPELGRWALPPGDPALANPAFSVDYVEAFSGPVGALNYDRQPDEKKEVNHVVAQSGDADTAAPVHTTLADAITAAHDGDVIEVADSVTYTSTPITLSNAAIKSLTIRAKAGTRPCFITSLAITVPMTQLRLEGLLLTGGGLSIQNVVADLSLLSCSLDPEPGVPSLVSNDTTVGSAVCTLSACVTGAIKTAVGVARINIADSIVDGKSGSAISAGRNVQLERTTVIGTITANALTASESLLNDLATVLDQQNGCIRFTRFEPGSVLPRRYQCLPNEDQMRSCAAKKRRCLAPLFHSKRFGRPDYLQLAASCDGLLLSASENGAEIGAFASSMNTIRLDNLRIKLREFLPAGLTAVLIANA